MMVWVPESRSKRYIEVELTETVSEEDNDRLRRFIGEMHESQIAIDLQKVADNFGHDLHRLCGEAAERRLW